jgi:hypothetical protein
VKHALSIAAAAALVVASSALAGTSTKQATLTPQLARTKAALARFRSVAAAKEAGYVATGPCEMSPTSKGQSSFGGVMGVHFVNDALLKSGKLDAKRPPILVYTPTAGGGFQLVAAEYFRPDRDQSTKTDGDRPTLFGRAFDGPMLGHFPGMPVHYDLHVWLWKHNPSGLFAPFNPEAHC